MSEHQCCGGANHAEGASSCGSGCCGGSCGGASMPQNGENPLEVHINPSEESFLQKLAQCPFLPVAQYLLTSSQDDELGNMALSPVFLETGAESLEEIKALGDVMLSLEERSIISLDFDSPLQGTDETLFYKSSSFALLEKTVEEGKAQEDFLFDAPTIIFGSVCLTALGDLVVDQLDFL